MIQNLRYDLKDDESSKDDDVFGKISLQHVAKVRFLICERRMVLPIVDK